MIEPMMKTPPADVSTAVTDAYVKAYNLNVRIVTSAQAAQMSLYEMCIALREMHETKLYKELGYVNFKDYCKDELGISFVQASKYIKIAETYCAAEVNSSLPLGVTKLALLCDLSEEQRTEISQNTDLEAASVRELKAEIAKLKADGEEKDQEIERRRDAQKQLFERAKSLMTEKRELEARLEELKSKPIEAVVVDDKKEIEELKSKLTETENKLSECERRLAEKPAIQEALPSPADSKEIFKAYLTTVVDAVNRLLEFVGHHSTDQNFELFVDKSWTVLYTAGQDLEKLKGEKICQ